jgi:hypothetical protein
MGDFSKRLGNHSHWRRPIELDSIPAPGTGRAEGLKWQDDARLASSTTKAADQNDQPARDRASAESDALEAQGLLTSAQIKAALLKVSREDFIPPEYRDFAYEEVPLPLPGTAATISCLHSYPLFYEPLDLGLGDRFLEIGTGGVDFYEAVRRAGAICRNGQETSACLRWLQLRTCALVQSPSWRLSMSSSSGAQPIDTLGRTSHGAPPTGCPGDARHHPLGDLHGTK